jgi:hypothetical protein
MCNGTAAPELLNGKKFDLTPQLNLRDPQVVRLVQLLQAEVETGSPTDSLIGGTIGSSLILYLLQHYSTAVPVQDQDQWRTAGTAAQASTGVYWGNLSRDIHLDELAETASLSSFHSQSLSSNQQVPAPQPPSVHLAAPARASQGSARESLL